MIVGVLALQGDFSKHEELLHNMGVETKQVRKPADLAECAALIIPGGESTTLFRQIEFIQLRQALIDFAAEKNVFGTCAGLILMSHAIEGSDREPLNILDITIERNAFGRQIDSFKRDLVIQLDHPTRFNAFFIRAPKIKAIGPQVEVLATLEKKPVLVRQGKHLGACFHPELTDNPLVHQLFLKMIQP
jgi:5'-phosphate synthase pdxT subunit